MKYRYIIPQSEVLPAQLSYSLLDDSGLIDYYGGEDATAQDGTW